MEKDKVKDPVIRMLSVLSDFGGAASLLEVALRADIKEQKAERIASEMESEKLIRWIRDQEYEILRITNKGRKKLYYG